MPSTFMLCWTKGFLIFWCSRIMNKKVLFECNLTNLLSTLKISQISGKIDPLLGSSQSRQWKNQNSPLKYIERLWKSSSHPLFWPYSSHTVIKPKIALKILSLRWRRIKNSPSLRSYSSYGFSSQGFHSRDPRICFKKLPRKKKWIRF